MGDRKRGVSDSQLRRYLRSSAVKAQVGATAGFSHHFNLEPIHASADAGSQGLGGGFLRGKSSGKALRRVAFAQAVSLFGGGKDAIQKPLSIALKRLLNPRDFNQVGTAPNDHAVYQPNIRVNPA